MCQTLQVSFAQNGYDLSNEQVLEYANSAPIRNQAEEEADDEEYGDPNAMEVNTETLETPDPVKAMKYVEYLMRYCELTELPYSFQEIMDDIEGHLNVSTLL